MGTSSESNKRAGSDRRIPLGTSGRAPMSSNSRETGRKNSTKGAEEIIRMAGWEVRTGRLGTTREGMGKMERKGFRYGMG